MSFLPSDDDVICTEKLVLTEAILFFQYISHHIHKLIYIIYQGYQT
jgi:hypothetical protein